MLQILVFLLAIFTFSPASPQYAHADSELPKCESAELQKRAENSIRIIESHPLLESAKNNFTKTGELVLCASPRKKIPLMPIIAVDYLSSKSLSRFNVQYIITAQMEVYSDTHVLMIRAEDGRPFSLHHFEKLLSSLIKELESHPILAPFIEKFQPSQIMISGSPKTLSGKNKILWKFGNNDFEVGPLSYGVEGRTISVNHDWKYNP